MMVIAFTCAKVERKTHLVVPKFLHMWTPHAYNTNLLPTFATLPNNIYTHDWMTDWLLNNEYSPGSTCCEKRERFANANEDRRKQREYTANVTFKMHVMYVQKHGKLQIAPLPC